MGLSLPRLQQLTIVHHCFHLQFCASATGQALTSTEHYTFMAVQKGDKHVGNTHFGNTYVLVHRWGGKTEKESTEVLSVIISNLELFSFSSYFSIKIRMNGKNVTIFGECVLISTVKVKYVMGHTFSPAAPPLQAGEGEGKGRTGSYRPEGGEPIYLRLIHSLNSFSHYESDIAPCAPDTTGNKTDKTSCPHGVYILVRGSRQDSR